MINNTKIYRLPNQRFPIIKRKIYIRVTVLMCLGLIFGVLIVGYRNLISNILPAIFAFVVILIFLGLEASTAIKNNKEIWDSIEIELGENYIVRKQIRIPSVRFDKDHIISIVELSQGLGIKTDDKYKSLLIPIELDQRDYQEIKAILSSWMEIEKPRRFFELTRNLRNTIIFAGLGITLISNNRWLVLIASCLFIGYYSYFYREFNSRKGIDPNYKRSFTRNIIIIFGLIIVKLFYIFGLFELVYKNFFPNN